MKPLVYVADDEPELASLLTEMLEDAGYAVNASPDGPTLLGKVGAKLPDLILLDINMPGMTGWEVRAKLAEMEAAKGIPVIAVTAQGGASIETSAMRTMEFSAFVRKPFKMAELLGAVERAVGPGKP